MENEFNFAIVRNIFGDHWIGKTKLPVDDSSIFSTYEDALETVKQYASYENTEN